MTPSLAAFTTAGGRVFTVGDGVRAERFKDDPLWCVTFPILHEGRLAGLLFHSDTYARTADGRSRWDASTRALYWRHAADAPVGVGFDVAAFDSAEEALAAWGRSADQILDWEAGKPVRTGYGRDGVVQKGRAA